MRVGVIYKIEIENYFSYGSTLYPKKRKITHKSNLKNNKHCNNFLQNLYNKYNYFKFTIMQENIPEDILGYVEDIWIGINCSKISDKKGGLNIIDGSRLDFNSIIKEKMSKSRKKYNNSLSVEERSARGKKGAKTRAEKYDLSELISKSRQKYKYENWENKQSYPILQLTLNDIPLKLWASAYQAKKEKNYLSSNISKCAQDISKTYKKYKWKFASPEDIIKYAHLKNTDVPVSIGQIKNRPVYQYDKNYQILKKWRNQRDISKNFNVNPALVHTWIKRKTWKDKKYLFSFDCELNNKK